MLPPCHRLYYIFILHQTTTVKTRAIFQVLLYYIFILHQTTTWQVSAKRWRGCIISSFYIKPQRNALKAEIRNGCIISSFYIKPQLLKALNVCFRSCIISSFYIKPQHTRVTYLVSPCCIISSFYIKPQPSPPNEFSKSMLYYIFILHQTTTHTMALR